MADAHEFDLIVWGATGFVGQRVAHHLATRGGDLRWAIAGRNRAKLEALRSGLGPASSDLPIVIADSHDAASLEAMVARTKVVCSLVGPYAKYGSELVAACVRAGTHYCDICGEAHWIRTMIDTHQADAERTGARIVHACGFDSIPSDIGVWFLQREANARHGRPCSRIRMRVRAMKGGLNGGTAATFLYANEQSKRDPSIGAVMTEPYGLNPPGLRHGPDRPQGLRSVGSVKYDEDLHAWTMPFFMGPMNTKIVRRTNAVLGYPYGEDFRYEEAIATGRGPAGWIKATTGALGSGGFMRALGAAPLRNLLKKYVLPKPGEGPDEAAREAGLFEYSLIGHLDDGAVMQARISGSGDPNTEATSKLVVEAAVCLVEESDAITVGGGFWTPASAMGDLLLGRLTSRQTIRVELVPTTRVDKDQRSEAEPAARA